MLEGQMCERINWGDVPTWIGAAATILAIIAAAAAAIQAKRLYTVESTRDAQAAADRIDSREIVDRQFAEKVCAWIDSEISTDDEPIPTVNIQNLGALPVFDLQVEAVDGSGAVLTLTFATFPPTSTPKIVPVLAVSDRDRVANAALRLAFRDAAGKRWVRQPSGSLDRG
jgi:hypothetical protein